MMIEVKLVQTNFFTRWPCTVCGGETNTDQILCEGENEENFVRACPDCLKTPADIDAKLEAHAAGLEQAARNLRSLKGNLILPTYEQWQQATAEVDKQRHAEYLDHVAEVAQQSANTDSPW